MRVATPWWRSGHVAAIAVFASAVVACGDTTVKEPALEVWLTCVECEAAEVDSLKVAASRESGVQIVLRETLLHGPSAARRAQLRLQLQRTHDRLAERVARDTMLDSVPFGRDAYVRHYLAKAERIYRSRAALGLGHIGGPAALAALDSALNLPSDSLPESVRKRVQFARDSLWHP